MGKLTSAAAVSPTLEVNLRHDIGALKVDVEFALTQSWTILFGPSGSGKSTILRAIAGLIRSNSARIVWKVSLQDDRQFNITFVDTASGEYIPAHRRFAPLAAQKASLFPHMTVRENVKYGMVLDRLDKDKGLNLDEKAEGMLALCRVLHVSEKRATALSGGEAQRVSLARAAAATTYESSGGLLLLDEPFAGLDPVLRTEIMHDLREWAAARTLCVLSVTHDVGEAFQLDAEVIKIADGRVVQQGPVEVVLAEERTRLLAQLNGAAGSPA